MYARFPAFFYFRYVLAVALSPVGQTTFVQAHLQTDIGDKKQALYNLFAAYVHTVPLGQLIETSNGPCLMVEKK
jgi:hypothetical protein